MITRILLLAILLSVAGCSRYNIEPPTTNYTEDLELVESSSAEIRSLPSVPEAELIDVDGKKMAAFDEQGLNDLLEFRYEARKNTSILNEVVLSNEARTAERNSLVSMSKELENRSNRLAEEWARAEENRRQADDARTIERWFYQTLLIAAIALLI